MDKIIKWIISLFKPPEQKPFTMDIQATPQAPVVTQDASIDPKWGLVPELAPIAEKFLVECASKGYLLKITQGLRTHAQQAALYAQGRTTPGVIVTNAMPGQSYHETGKAFDVCFKGLAPYPSDDAHWKAIADIGVQCGLTAGYYFHTFPDRPHFQI